jgi:HTH-type transcriptional regulator / antitoxin HipB
MQDIRWLADLGQAVRAARLASRLTTVEVARNSGRSRDVLHRLENGQDVSLSSLLAMLAAIGKCIGFASATRPTLPEMQRRFAQVFEQADASTNDEVLASKPRRARR